MLPTKLPIAFVNIFIYEEKGTFSRCTTHIPVALVTSTITPLHDSITMTKSTIPFPSITGARFIIEGFLL